MGRPLPGAFSPEDREVILGMPGAWADENDESDDHYVTKIGGQPDWPAPLKPLIKREQLTCAVCGGYLGLVAQVHSPLTSHGLNFPERTLYILGCPAQGCGIDPNSWRTIRIQKNTSEGSTSGVEHTSGREDSSNSSAANAPDPGFEWGGASTPQEEIGRTQRDDWSWDETWDGIPADEPNYLEADTMNFRELQSSLTEAAQMAATVSGSQLNSGTSRTSGAQRSTGASVRRDSDQGLPVLSCFYIYTQTESSIERGPSASVSNPEVGLQADEENEDTSGAEDGEVWGSEEYEHDQALFADRTYLKFKKKLDCFPEQCFRYSFGGQPLWAVDEHRDQTSCAACGGPRVFEMQLMPPLLYYLQQAHKDLPPSLYGPEDWDWHTLMVFSCAQSCVQEESQQLGVLGEKTEWSFIEEATVVQQDLNVAIMR